MACILPQKALLVAATNHKTSCCRKHAI